MPKLLTSREYDTLTQRLERMADGISKHKTEKNFPSHIKEEDIRGKRKELEDSRSKYEALAQQASKAYDEYKKHFDICNRELAKYDDTIRGFYGKSSPMVNDFGTKPFTIPVGRIKKSRDKEPSA
ncbi:MAG: hypothetical protein JNN15_10415 [Blastocatellia bacterium]|nr:hypothetical protein [Blastocatellia bacterium]